MFKIIDANLEADLEAEEMIEGTIEDPTGDDQDPDQIHEEEGMTVIAAVETDQDLALAERKTQDAQTLVHPVEAEREEEALLLTREALLLLIESLSKIQAAMETPKYERLSRII